MQGHRLLKFLRAAHLYLGVFTAPALLFFAFTGALQTFDLHEAARGSDYKPPMWLQTMSHLHKKQSLGVPVRRAPSGSSSLRGENALKDRDTVGPSARSAVVQPDAAEGKPTRSPVDRPPTRNLLPMKIYFALVGLSLFISTLTGLYMSSRLSRSARRIAATFAAGILVPLLLLAI